MISFYCFFSFRRLFGKKGLITAKVLKRQCAPEAPGGLIKTHLPGPHPPGCLTQWEPMGLCV